MHKYLNHLSLAELERIRYLSTAPDAARAAAQPEALLDRQLALEWACDQDEIKALQDVLTAVARIARTCGPSEAQMLNALASIDELATRAVGAPSAAPQQPTSHAAQ